jgi:hypothetical protein
MLQKKENDRPDITRVHILLNVIKTSIKDNEIKNYKDSILKLNSDTTPTIQYVKPVGETINRMNERRRSSSHSLNFPCKCTIKVGISIIYIIRLIIELTAGILGNNNNSC